MMTSEPLRESLTALGAVVFDFDGTLVDSRIDFARMRAAMVAHLQDWGIDGGAGEEQRYVLEMIAHGRERLAHAPLRGAAFVRRAMEIIEAIEMETCAHAAPYAGVMETLGALRRLGFRIGIITRNGRSGVNAVLSRFALPHDALLTRHDVANVKPHPEHLLQALEALKAAPAEALMVGDHPTDMVCAKAAGTLAVGVLTYPERRASLLASGADLLIERIPDLLEHLDGQRPPRVSDPR
jgi:phosphoglycolate phosphatase